MTRKYLEFISKLISDKSFRNKHKELRRLSRLPRYNPTITNLLGKPLEIVDNSSFFAIYEDVVENEIYKFKADSETPFIIDGGVNIGLSSIYLKMLYPKARIVAFEPDENLCRISRKNFSNFGIDDIELHQKALWSENTTLSFMAEGADSGRVIDTTHKKAVPVEAIRLKDFLKDEVDFLKLDIEGAEFQVLEDCADDLHKVKNMFVEYHSFTEKPQTIDRLLQILISAGFRLNAHPCNVHKSPFCERINYLGMDFQMNIFAFR